MFGLPKGLDALVIIGIALLVFGNRLPSLGRSLGKGIVEFKKGLKGIEDEVSDVDREIDTAATAEAPKPAPARQIESRSQPAAPAASRKQKQEA